MKTKPSKKGEESKISEDANDSVSEVSSVPANSFAPVAEPEKTNRISIPLTKDGQIEWDSMREKTREKVKQLIGAPSGAPSAAPVEVFDPAWTGAMYDTIGKIESFAAVKLYKFTPEIADLAFAYTPAEKEKLAGPTAKVINKYAPAWLEQFKEEIALAMLFVTFTAVKFQMASALMAQHNAMQSMKERATPPRPIDSPLPSAQDLDVVM